MKKIISILFLFFIFVGCEDIIEVDVPQEPPRLTVDAVIRIDDSSYLTRVILKIGQSSSFFNDNVPVTVEQLLIQNPDYESSGPIDPNFITFTETAPGVYESTKNTSFFTSGNLLLTIDYNNETYTSTAVFVPTAPIDKLEQGDQTLFSGEEIEIKVAFTDNGERDDFYLFDFDFNQFLVTEDEFYQGQTFEFSYFYDEDLESGSIVNISILGVDEAFYNYMNQIIVQSGGDQGPFQTPAATVRGNIINTTDPDNFALGYFAVVQEFEESITIE